jgi:hypothetical protein
VNSAHYLPPAAGPPFRSNSSREKQDDEDDQDDAEDTDAAVTEAVAVAAETTTEATKQKDDEEDDEDESERRHDLSPVAASRASARYFRRAVVIDLHDPAGKLARTAHVRGDPFEDDDIHFVLIGDEGARSGPGHKDLRAFDYRNECVRIGGYRRFGLLAHGTLCAQFFDGVSLWFERPSHLGIPFIAGAAINVQVRLSFSETAICSKLLTW